MLKLIFQFLYVLFSLFDIEGLKFLQLHIRQQTLRRLIPRSQIKLLLAQLLLQKCVAFLLLGQTVNDLLLTPHNVVESFEYPVALHFNFFADLPICLRHILLDD